MPSLYLRADVGVCGFADCAIVLDVPADRYWYIPAPLHETLVALANGSGDVDPVHLAELSGPLSLFTLDPGAAAQPRDRVLPDPAASALEGSTEGPDRRLTVAASVWTSTITSRAALVRRPLARTVAGVRRSLAGAKAMDLRDPERIARDFAYHRRFVPLARRCLPDTLAFLRYAHARGCPARLVFGVQAYPFAAHCWAQLGDLVLDDLLDHARAVRPILVV